MLSPDGARSSEDGSLNLRVGDSTEAYKAEWALDIFIAASIACPTKAQQCGLTSRLRPGSTFPYISPFFHASDDHRLANFGCQNRGSRVLLRICEELEMPLSRLCVVTCITSLPHGMLSSGDVELPAGSFAAAPVLEGLTLSGYLAASVNRFFSLRVSQ